MYMVVDYVLVWGHYGGDFCGVVWIMVVDVLATGDPGVFGIYIYIYIGTGYWIRIVVPAQGCLAAVLGLCLVGSGLSARQRVLEVTMLRWTTVVEATYMSGNITMGYFWYTSMVTYLARGDR